MTRPNPSAMLPATNFGDPSAQNATQGNPDLQPYLSTNIDIGGEWYTGDEGYVGLTLFGKQMTGTLTSPCDCIVAQQRVADGQYANKGDVIFQLVPRNSEANVIRTNRDARALEQERT